MRLGPVRRWREGDVLFAENDLISGAFIVTSDSEKIGKLGFHPYGCTEMCVEYISAETARAWGPQRA